MTKKVNQVETFNLYKQLDVLWSESSDCEKKFKKFYISGEEVSVCFYGRIFNAEYTVEKIIQLFLGRQYREMVCIPGSYSFVLVHNCMVYVYTGNAHSHPFYSLCEGKKIYLSDDFEAIATRIQADPSNQRLAALCWGANCLPYNNFVVLKTNSVYQICHKVELKWAYKISTKKNNLRFDDICIEAKQRIEAAVASCLTGQKIALSLSGGIDSSVLAICLKKLGANFECFHWTSDEYSPIDERSHAKELCDKYDIKLNLIDIGEGIRGNVDYVNPHAQYYLPYNHSSFYWWEKTVMAAKERGCEVLFSGLNGDGLFSAPFSLISFSDLFGENFFWKIKYWWNSFGIPNRESFRLNNDETKHSIFEYLFLRRAEFMRDDYLHAIANGNKEEVFIQKESLRMNLFNRYQIECINPYLDQKLIDFCAGLPKYFKSIPVSGRIVQKPVLKMAFKEELPFSIFARNSKSNFGILSQKFCAMNIDFLYDCLNTYSELQLRGIIEEEKLKKVLNDKNKLSQNAYSLIRSCFVEFWLKQKEVNENV